MSDIGNGKNNTTINKQHIPNKKCPNPVGHRGAQDQNPLGLAPNQPNLTNLSKQVEISKSKNYSNYSVHNNVTKKDMKTKNNFYISTLNTRTLRTEESLQELEQALENINWDIIGISEVRRMGEKIEQYENYVLYHIGNTPGQFGVGFLVQRWLGKYIQEFIGISERIAQINIDLPEYGSISVIQIYAPTEIAPEEHKDTFYRDLEGTLEKAHKTIFLIGDFNGQIGKRQAGEESILGLHSTGRRNNNGQRLINLALTANLKILNSFFHKKIQRKWTWISPDGQIKNEIDFILSNKPKIFKDISTVNKLNFNTNHRMIRGTIHLNKPKPVRKHMNRSTQPTHIPLPIPENLLTPLRSKRTEIEDIVNIQEKYNRLEEEIQKVSEKLCCVKKKKDGIGDKARSLIDSRKILLGNRKENRIQITKLSKQINEEIRIHRKEMRSRTIQFHIEKSGGIKKALKELKETTCWIPNINNKTSRKKETRRPQIMQIATELYSNLYDDTNDTESHYLVEDYEETVPHILESEVRNAVLSQKNYKAPGEDKITNEVLKGCLDCIIKLFFFFF